jgi:hypothetical protein
MKKLAQVAFSNFELQHTVVNICADNAVRILREFTTEKSLSYFAGGLLKNHSLWSNSGLL